jgi:hypothetical protein
MQHAAITRGYRPANTNATPVPDTLRPAAGTQLFVLGEEGVLFNEAKGTLHRLKQTAARYWCALARISHQIRRIGAPNQRKSLCCSDF